MIFITEAGIAEIPFVIGGTGEVRFFVEALDDAGITMESNATLDFEESDGGFEVWYPPDKWRWGVPTKGVYEAHSGDKVWVAYHDALAADQGSMLVAPWIAIPAEARLPRLEFWHRHFLPIESARTRVEITTDGETWDQPDHVPFFGGRRDEWERQSLPIDEYVGRRVRFRFVFGIDDRDPIEYWWAIDDLRIAGVPDRVVSYLPGRDEDRDRIFNVRELTLGTDVEHRDTDRDGLSDHAETGTGSFIGVHDTGTMPDLRNSSGSGLDDFMSTFWGLDPNSVESPFVPWRTSPARGWNVDSNGIEWSVTSGGSFTGHEFGGGFGLQLLVNDYAFRAKDEDRAHIRVEGWGTHAVLGPQDHGDFLVYRDLWISRSELGFIRAMSIIVNTSGAPLDLEARHIGKMGHSGAQVRLSSDGDRLMEARDLWFISAYGNESTGPGIVFGNTDGHLRPVRARWDERTTEFELEYEFRLEPGEVGAIWVYGLRETNPETARRLASELVGDRRSFPEGFDDMVKTRSPVVPFHRGDANADGRQDISDCIFTVGYLFSGDNVPCLDSVDIDDNGSIDVSDAIFSSSYLFLGTRAPPFPGSVDSPCDLDPDPPGAIGYLGCAAYGRCFQ